MSTYWMFAASDRLSEAFHELREKLEDETEAPIKVPDDLKAKVESKLQEQPHLTWHRGRPPRC
jgi:hypothetical protein